jgi:hypothetical protein
MQRGGGRSGAGRKKGMASSNKSDLFEGDAYTSLVAIYWDEELPLVLRIDAAKACIPFEKRPLDAEYNGVVPHHMA